MILLPILSLAAAAQAPAPTEIANAGGFHSIEENAADGKSSGMGCLGIRPRSVSHSLRVGLLFWLTAKAGNWV